VARGASEAASPLAPATAFGSAVSLLFVSVRVRCWLKGSLPVFDEFHVIRSYMNALGIATFLIWADPQLLM